MPGQRKVTGRCSLKNDPPITNFTCYNKNYIYMQKNKIKNKKSNDDSFFLYDLKVEVIKGKGKMICNHKVGDYFELSGENLSIPNGKTFSIYALAALLPLLPAKQRETHKNDWMTTDNIIACPDPHCAGRFKITRTQKRTFKHSDVSAVSLK